MDDMTPAGLGHNNGPTFEPGYSWRKYVWTKARRNLLPTLPIEVVRLRVKRSAELGLPYKTYAGIRASTGHDLIGFMFSSNALNVMRSGQAMPAPIAQKLAALQSTDRVALTYPRIDPDDLAQLSMIDAAFAAPPVHASWGTARARIKAIARAQGAPADRYLVISATPDERDWAAAGQTAGYLQDARYFASLPT